MQKEGPIASYQDSVLIYNPVAGRIRASGGRIIGDTLQQLEARGVRARAIATTGPRTATAMARDLCAAAPELVIALGGDGTINEIANGMIHSAVPLAVLPGGTANVLANELGIGNRISRAVDLLPSAEPRRIAAGHLHTADTSRYFLMMAGAGLDAQIIHELNPGLKKRVGKAAYWVAGFSLVARKIAPLEVRNDGDSFRCGFALASRVKNYGGDLTIARNASLLDDDFEVVGLEGTYAPRYLAHLTGAVTGTLYRLPGVHVARAKAVEMLPAGPEPVFVQVDGELVGALPATVEIVSDAITLMFPERR